MVPVSEGEPVKFNDPPERSIGLFIAAPATKSPEGLIVIEPAPAEVALVERTVPPLIFTPPLNVFEAERMSRPGPFCVIPALPPTAPAKVSVVSLSS